MPVAASSVISTSDDPPRPKVWVHGRVRAGTNTGRRWRRKVDRVSAARSRSVCARSGRGKIDRHTRSSQCRHAAAPAPPPSTAAGFDAYTHTVGHVFSPAVSLIFLLKILFLGLTVSLMPIASVLDAVPRRRANTSAELQGLVRMFLVIVIIEAASLVGNYY